MADPTINNLSEGQAAVVIAIVVVYGFGSIFMMMVHSSQISLGDAGRWEKDGVLSVLYVLAGLVWPFVLLGLFINKYCLREGYTCCGINYASRRRRKAADEEQPANVPRNQGPIDCQPTPQGTELQDISLARRPPSYRL